MKTCHTQLVLCIGLMLIGVVCAAGMVWAQINGQPLDNSLTTGLTGIITGAFGFMQRPSSPPPPPPPGTHRESEVKETTNTPPTTP